MLAVRLWLLCLVLLMSACVSAPHEDVPGWFTEDLAGAATHGLTNAQAFQLVAGHIGEEELRAFLLGRRLFETEWAPAPGPVPMVDGLGPRFNAVSCAACHVRDGRGPGPNEDGVVPDSVLAMLPIARGGQHRPHAVPGVPPLGPLRITWRETEDGLRTPILPEGVAGLRVTPHMVGLGLLEAVPESYLLSIADPDDHDGDGISGRLGLGRFGWKATQPTVRDQTAHAAAQDMGLRSVLAPEDQTCGPGDSVCLAVAAAEPWGDDLWRGHLDVLAFYAASLGVPALRHADDPQVRRGARVFEVMGCASCHRPTLPLTDHRAGDKIHPFTDLLLHDMGEGLADQTKLGDADAREWRTPPLWGLGLVPTVNGHSTLLHDGRARGFDEAIRWHGGEGQASQDAYAAATEADRQALLRFLAAL